MVAVSIYAVVEKMVRLTGQGVPLGLLHIIKLAEGGQKPRL